MKTSVVVILVCCLGFVTSCGKGKGCSPAGPPPAATVKPVVTADETARPAPDTSPGGLGMLERFAPMLPAGTSILAVFPVSTLVSSLDELSDSFVQLVLMEGKAALPERLQVVYGVDLQGLGPYCAFFSGRDGGAALICEGCKSVKAPKGHDLWKQGTASGHYVKRGNHTVAVGLIGDRLLVGNETAIRQLATVERGDWPALSKGMGRQMARLRSLAGANPWKDVAVFFLKPELAPWCPADTCLGTAVFADLGREAILVVDAGNDKAEAARAAVESFWSEMVASFARTRDTVELERKPPIPDKAVKKADLLVLRGEIAVRGHQVRIQGPGHALYLAAILHPALLSDYLGPPVEWLER
ncbi:MAG: hypothetical protein ISR64_04465 [Deltaproteobacteria bacterium]|nr:hypothetical protein [Deltaproteobacteria bacterium]